MCLKYFQGTKQAFVICWGQAAVVGERGEDVVGVFSSPVAPLGGCVYGGGWEG